MLQIQPGQAAALILEPDEIRFLIDIRREGRRLFRVGDIAERAYRRALERGVPSFLPFSAIGELAGIGARRVAKLRRIAGAFPPEVRERWPQMPFAYFEAAYDFPPEEREGILEMAQVYFEDRGRWPGAERLGTIYRGVVMGLDVRPLPSSTTRAGGEDGRNERTSRVVAALPVSSSPKRWVAGDALRALLLQWEEGTTVEQCIRDVRLLLGEQA